MNKGSMVVCATLLAAGLAAPAQAGTVINLTGNTGTSGSFGNTRQFSATANGQSVAVNASAWSISGDVVTTAYLGAFSNGLGVTNRSEGNGGNGEHTIDNGGQGDFVLLQFNRSVSLLGATLSTYGDTDVTFASFNALPLAGSTLATMQAGMTSLSNSLGGTASRFALNPSTNFSSVWAVGALFPADGSRDAFKLRSVEIAVAPAVPEPSTWALLLLGFGAIGAAMRRTRAQRVSFNFA